MKIFKPINDYKGNAKVKKIFNEIKKTRKISKIPNFWKSIAHNPILLERTWNNLKQIMKDGALDSVTKELIYVAVSITNSCNYCIRSHTFAAKKKGASDDMIKLAKVIDTAKDLRAVQKELMWSNCTACHSRFRAPH